MTGVFRRFSTLESGWRTGLALYAAAASLLAVVVLYADARITQTRAMTELSQGQVHSVTRLNALDSLHSQIGRLRTATTARDPGATEEREAAILQSVAALKRDVASDDAIPAALRGNLAYKLDRIELLSGQFAGRVREVRAALARGDTQGAVDASRAGNALYEALDLSVADLRSRISVWQADQARLALGRVRASADKTTWGLGLVTLGALALLGVSLAANKRAGQALLERNAALDSAEARRGLLDTVIGGSLDGTIVIDGQGRVELFSRAAEQIFGYAAEEVIGQNVSVLMPQDVARRHPDILARYEAEGRSMVVGTRRVVDAHRKDGSTFRLALALAEVSVGGRRKFVSAVRDVSDEEARVEELARAREQAEAANRAKSAFLASMSHEIRTPLNGVLGMAAGLGATRLNRAQKEMVGAILSSGELLLGLLNDILDLSRIEAGKLELAPAPTDLAALFEQTLQLHRGVAEEKGLELIAHVDPALTGAHDVDPLRLRQVLGNLVGNAVKFTARGRVEAAVTRVGGDGTRDRLRWTVRDTGPGFDESVRERLFRDFEQADASVTRQHGGSGLGLAICRRIVGLFGGEIGCVSTPGGGSTFWFELDLPRAAEAPAEEAPPGTALPDRALRVLCAEDNPTNRRVLDVLLAPLGIRPTFAENGAEAVAAFEREVFDLVLMDLRMPVMDGFAAARELRRIEARDGRPSTPVIALTADAMPEQVALCREAGMTAHVAKPVRPDALFAAMERALGEHGSEISTEQAA